MTSKSEKEPPLESSQFSRLYDPEGKAYAILTKHQRGFLSDWEIRPLKGETRLLGYKSDGKLALDRLIETLRNRLDAAGLATDKWPVMPIELDFGYVPDEHGVYPDDEIWLAHAEWSTEPLTELRITAQFLHALIRIRDDCPAHLISDVFRAIALSPLYKLVGKLNKLAIAGSEAQKARAKGPQVKSEKAKATQDLVLRLAEAFWIEHPRFKGNLGKTAQRIAARVNDARRKTDPKAKRLAAKTIADHLSKALAGDNS